MFGLFEIEGLSASEVAATLDCKLNTVYSRLRRARAAIVRAMAQYDADLAPPTLEKDHHG